MPVPAGRFYRVVRSPTVTVRDFLPPPALGRQPRRPLTDEEAVYWQGISVFDTIDHAREHVGRSRFLGSFVAELTIPEANDLTGRRSFDASGHWTLWGEAGEMLSYLTAIIALEDGESI